MKLLLPLLFLSSFCKAQSISDSSSRGVYNELLKTNDYRKNDQATFDACKLGVDSAQQDLKNGILRYFFVGLSIPYRETGENYISNKYGITAEYPGCSSETDIECYNFYIDQILAGKYGAGFWARAWQEVDSLQMLGMLDRHVSYKGNHRALHKDLFELIKKENLTQKTDSIQISCDVTIDTFGTIVKVTGLDCTPKSLNRKFEVAIKKLKGWLPTIKASNKKISQMSLFFFWTKETGEWWLKEM